MRLQTQLHFVKSWSAGRDRSEHEIVFVLGAGASADAELPLAPELTRHWRGELLERIPRSASILRVIDGVRQHNEHGRIGDDYEEIFWWLQTLFERPSLRKPLGIDPAVYADVYSKIRDESRDIIAEYLAALEHSGGDVAYLSRLAEFAKTDQAVSVFTLNYDTCVERACRNSGIPIVTGFDGADVHRRGWHPETFRRELMRGGVHLYKLHGSLSWFGSDPNTFEDLEPPDPGRKKSRYDVRPQLILGPMSKVQSDDPFWWLLDQFYAALKRARTCVVIGFSGRDPHIAQRIAHERSLGLDVVEVGPAVQPIREPNFPDAHRFETGTWVGIDSSASDALTSGRIHDALKDLTRLRRA